MSIIKKLLLVFFLSTAFGQMKGQDVYFSQFYNIPALLNPALSGDYQGSYRLFSQYRSQWGSILDNPIKDFAVGGDAVFDMTYNRRKKPDRVSASMIFLSDEYGAFDFGTNGISFGTAFHKSLNDNYHQYLSAGVQLGINTRNFIYEDIVFADQFNGVDAFDGITGENRPENNFAYFDLNFGLSYSMSLDNLPWMQIGISGQHVMQPNISFYETIDDPTGIIQKDNPLLRRFNVVASLEYELSSFVKIIPRVIYSKQESFTLIQGGSNVSIAVGDQGGRAVQAGAAIRAVDNIDGLAITEVQLLAGFENRRTQYWFQL